MDINIFEKLTAVAILALAIPAASVGGTSEQPDGVTVYTATWCPPCAIYKHALRRLKADGYPVRVVDIDLESGGYRPKRVPETHFFKGKTWIRSSVGVRTYRQLKSELTPPQ